MDCTHPQLVHPAAAARVAGHLADRAGPGMSSPFDDDASEFLVLRARSGDFCLWPAWADVPPAGRRPRPVRAPRLPRLDRVSVS